MDGFNLIHGLSYKRKENLNERIMKRIAMYFTMFILTMNVLFVFSGILYLIHRITYGMSNTVRLLACVVVMIEGMYQIPVLLVKCNRVKRVFEKGKK